MSNKQLLEPDGFSLEDIFNEIDQNPSNPKKKTLTEKEKIVVIRARDRSKPASFNYLSKRWFDWFGREISRNTLANLYSEISEEEKRKILEESNNK